MNATATAGQTAAEQLIPIIDGIKAMIDEQPTAPLTSAELFALDPALVDASRAFRALSLIDQLAYLRSLATACRVAQLDQTTHA